MNSVYTYNLGSNFIRYSTSYTYILGNNKC